MPILRASRHGDIPFTNASVEKARFAALRIPALVILLTPFGGGKENRGDYSMIRCARGAPTPARGAPATTHRICAPAEISVWSAFLSRAVATFCDRSREAKAPNVACKSMTKASNSWAGPEGSLDCSLIFTIFPLRRSRYASKPWPNRRGSGAWKLCRILSSEAGNNRFQTLEHL